MLNVFKELARESLDCEIKRYTKFNDFPELCQTGTDTYSHLVFENFHLVPLWSYQQGIIQREYSAVIFEPTLREIYRSEISTLIIINQEELLAILRTKNRSGKFITKNFLDWTIEKKLWSGND